MKYFKILSCVYACSLAFWILPCDRAQATEQIVLTVDQSQVIALPQPPATVVVGNPSIANATTEGNTLFLHPKGYGSTNVLVLDSQGRTTGDYLINVTAEDQVNAHIYTPRGRETYSCARECQPTLQIGDNPGFFVMVNQQISDKVSVAENISSGQSRLPVGSAQPQSGP